MLATGTGRRLFLAERHRARPAGGGMCAAVRRPLLLLGLPHSLTGDASKQYVSLVVRIQAKRFVLAPCHRPEKQPSADHDRESADHGLVVVVVV